MKSTINVIVAIDGMPKNNKFKEAEKEARNASLMVYSYDQSFYSEIRVNAVWATLHLPPNFLSRIGYFQSLELVPG